MRRPGRNLIAGLVLAAAAFAAGPARAETHDAASVALGWQLEHADAVVVGAVTREDRDAAAETRTIEVRVDENVAGTSAAGTVVTVTFADHGLGTPWDTRVPVLLFLRREAGLPGAPARWLPVSGAFSVRPLASGTAEARFPALVGQLRDAMADPAALRALLVAWMEDSDPGVAWSAATDFVRHEELHAGLSDPERARIVAAFARQPIGKTTKETLAYAAAATRTPSAVRALADSLLLDGSLRIRSAVGEALRRMDTPAAETELASRLAGARPDQQASLLAALGVAGSGSAAPAAQSLLASADGAVRIEAAAALGGMARNARRRDPAARLGVAAALDARLTAKDAASLPADEVRAVLWALAQLDESEGYAALRTFEKSSAPGTLRDYATQLLARPRLSLVLAGAPK